MNDCGGVPVSSLSKKIDFVAIATVRNANPNGDPLNGNRPRITDDGYGEISDVCIKRKIRNRLMQMGESVFVQSDDSKTDSYGSLRERAEANEELEAVKRDKKSQTQRKDYADVACKSWIDVRGFGQLFAFKEQKKGEGLSIGVRGPVTVQSAFSVDPVVLESIQITKSVNSEPAKTSETMSAQRGSDTMGLKHRVSFGVYLIKGSMNCQLASITGFSDEDADKIRQAIQTLFVNDASSARPEGSMDIHTLYWFEHDSKLGRYPSAKVHNSVIVKLKEDVIFPKSLADYTIQVDVLEGLVPTIYHGYDGLNE